MDRDEPRQEWVFIVRVWLEPSGTGPPSLRGSARDVAGGSSVFFTSARDLADYLTLRGTARDPPADG